MESSHKLLYMDGLNFAADFFQRDGSFWRFEEARNLVHEFVEAARATEFHLEVFIDAGISTQET